MAELDKLLDIMARLRDPQGGCPWDREQDFPTLVHYTLEEVYEVVDAIERADYPHLLEELGDLLFQIVFYAQIASERGLFDMGMVIDGIAAKLLARHPHVFAVDSAAMEKPDMPQLHADWERRKQQERAAKGIQGVLGDVPVALPALQRAHKIQSRLARAGFDWQEAAAVLQQVRAELDELEEAMQQGNLAACTDELGDVIFSCVNLARHLRVDPEQALRNCNNKVSRRIEWMEATLRTRQRHWQQCSAQELEDLWQAAKQALRATAS